MQGIDKIVETILMGAKDDAKVTADETARQIKALKDKAQRELDADLKVIRDAAAQKSKERERRAATMLDVERRRSSLAVKRSLVDEAFDHSVAALNALEGEAYEGFIVKLLKEACDSGKEEVVVGADEKKLNANLIAKANDALKAEGRVGELTLSQETRLLDGGFILRSGGVETNCSFGMLVRGVRPELEKDVANLLF